MLMGNIMYDVKGKVAQQKISKRSLDFVGGNTNSYAKCINGPKRLKEAREINELVASVSEVISEESEGKAGNK